MTDVKIRCDDCKFVENCVDYGWEGCRKFTQKAHEPMTNEEYLRSCNTEQLVGAIYEWHSLGYTRHRIGRKLDDATIVLEWLKQPHKE